MLPADCRVKIEMDDYGEGACGVASESLVRGRAQRERDDFHSDRHGGAFLTSSPVSIKTPRYTDYSLATPAPHLMSLGPFPCPAQLPQTEYARRLQDRLEAAHSFARGQLLSAGRPVGPLSRHRHPSTYSSEPCSSPHRCEWAPDTHTSVFWPWVPT
ncbi:unnamed protein product [Gadus morhua 'NCC']